MASAPLPSGAGVASVAGRINLPAVVEAAPPRGPRAFLTPPTRRFETERRSHGMAYRMRLWNEARRALDEARLVHRIDLRA